MPSEREQPPAIDIKAALSYADGDRDMLLALAQLFLDDEGPRQLSAVEECVRNGDVTGIRRTAHQLRGSLAIFGAHKAVDATVDLESAAAHDDLTGVPLAWNALTREMQSLFCEVEKLCRD